MPPLDPFEHWEHFRARDYGFIPVANTHEVHAQPPVFEGLKLVRMGDTLRVSRVLVPGIVLHEGWEYGNDIHKAMQCELLAMFSLFAESVEDMNHGRIIDVWVHQAVTEGISAPMLGSVMQGTDDEWVTLVELGNREQTRNNVLDGVET